MRTVKCPSCGRPIAVRDGEQIIQCACGKAYKNPFIKSVQVVGAEKGASTVCTNDMLSNLIVLRTALFKLHEIQEEINSNNEEIRQCELNISGNENSDYSEFSRLESEKRDKLLRRQSILYGFFSWNSWIFPIVTIILTAFLTWFGVAPYPFPSIRALLPWDMELKTFAECSSAGGGGEYVYTIIVGGVMAIIIGLIVFIIMRIAYKIVRRVVRSNEEDIKSSEMKISKKKMVVYENNVRLRENQSKKYFERINQLKYRINELSTYIGQSMNYLKEEFGGFLHVSDWENIDYLIYLFITGRADDRKEALQLLDKEKRTSRIVGTIHELASYVSKNINSAISELRSSLTSQMNTINNSLKLNLALQTAVASYMMPSNEIVRSIQRCVSF